MQPFKKQHFIIVFPFLLIEVFYNPGYWLVQYIESC